jgi:hypothetical protein
MAEHNAAMVNVAVESPRQAHRDAMNAVGPLATEALHPDMECATKGRSCQQLIGRLAALVHVVDVQEDHPWRHHHVFHGSPRLVQEYQLGLPVVLLQLGRALHGLEHGLPAAAVQHVDLLRGQVLVPCPCRVV